MKSNLRVLYILIASLLCILRPSFAQISSDGLVAHYSFSGGFKDAKSSILGVNHGASFTTDRFGNPNSALLLNNTSSSIQATGQYVSLPNPSNSFFNADFTIVFWFKTEDKGRRMYLLSNDQTSNVSNLNFELNDGTASYLYWNGTGSPGIYQEAINKYSDNQWHQAVIRRTSNLLELYIDSNLIGANNQTSGTVGNNTHPFVLGYNLAAPYFDPYGFKGSIDDISFYKTSVPIRDLSLIAFYPFNNSFQSSTGGLYGVNKGSSFTTDRFGNLNNALKISNTNASDKTIAQYVTIPNPSNSFFDKEFTISFWFKTSHANDNRRMYLLSNDQTGIDANLNFELNDGTASYLYWNGQGSPGIYQEAINKYSDDKWHYVVIIATFTKLNLYIDLNLIGSENRGKTTVGNNIEPLILGYNLFTGFGFQKAGFDGAIDDLAFYCKPLKMEDMKADFSGGLLASFDFAAGSIADKSGFNNTASLNSVTKNVNDLPVLTCDRFGNKNAAYSFNGKGYLKIDPFSSSSPNFYSNDFSISFWMKSNSIDNRVFLVSLGYNSLSPTANLNLEINNVSPQSSIMAYWNGGKQLQVAGSTNQYRDNKWHLVTLIRDKKGKTVSLFIDAVNKGSVTDNSASIGINSSPIYFGTANYSTLNEYGWRGELDDIKFYSRKLSQQEISFDYNSVSNNNSLTINFPLQNDNWAVNSYHNVTWTSSVDSRVDLTISYDNGVTWETLTTDKPSLAGIVNKHLLQVKNRIGSAIVKVNNGCYSLNRKFNIIASQEKSYLWSNVLNGQPYDASQFCSVPFKNLPKWRDGAELRALNGKMYLMGGWNPSNPKDCDGNNVFNKDRTNEIWSTTDGLAWVREVPYSSDRTKIWGERHVFANLVHSGELWILGGDPNGGDYLNDVWKSSDGKNWNLQGILPENLKNRVLSLYNEFNGQMWIMGGQTFPEMIPNGPPLITYNDVYSSTDGLNWSKKKDASWPARGVYSGNVVLNGKMWVLGGGIYQSTYLNDVWSTSDGNNWTQEVDFAPWEGRQYHNVAVYDDKMWIIGGANPRASKSIMDDNTNLNDAWYSGDGKNWYQVLNSPWPHRHASSVEVFNGELYLIAGNNIPAYNVLYLGLKGQAPIDVYKLSKSNGSAARVATSTTETNVKSNIKQEELQYGLKVYPNPSDGYFNIEIPNNVEAFSIIIYTALGSEVFKSDLSTGSTFHVGGLTKEGLYLVRLVDSKGNTIGIGKLLISR